MNEVLVDAPCGRLRGFSTPKGAAFLGVRYGEARRWKSPVAARRKAGLIDATRIGASPPQTPSPATPWRPAFSPREMSEDCLNLNVWTPAPDGARRPTLVHVFGGGFETGSASEGLQDGANLAAQGDVVVVRVNFRIGALGFLHLADAFGANYAAANRGALDLVLALTWVRDNITAFGGDPDNVTLFGLSSGAFTIAALFAVPESRGLFHKAWMQSGSASRVLTRAQAAELTHTFLRAAGVADADALQSLDVATILRAQREAAALDLGDRNAPGGHTLGIVEDGASLREHPMRVFERGDRRDVPVVLGTTRDEARLWFASGAMRIPASFDDVADEMRRFGAGANLLAYYRRCVPQADPTELRERFLTDAVYTVPALRTAEAHRRAGGAAFVYRFEWAPPGEFARLGAAHGFDEAFVWNAVDDPAFGIAAGDAEARQLAQTLSSALFDFARRGAPAWPPSGSSAFLTYFPALLATELLTAWGSIERR